MTRTTATAIGFTAVILWASLAALTVASAPVPPFLLNALTFAVGGTIGLIWAVASGSLAALRRVPATVYVLGTLGLFGYHALYFSALRLAPPAEAGLIAYLWPLFIVLGSGLMPGEHLRRSHVLGALIAFGGAVLILSGGIGAGARENALGGYALAFICALTWAGYSLVSRSAAKVPTVVVTVYCLATAALSAVVHLIFETTQWPVDWQGWAAVAGLGLGPVGLAFFTWDIGVKRGDIQLLGTASYAAPLLSTLLLIATGLSQAGWVVIVAAAMIALGAALAARAARA